MTPIVACRAIIGALCSLRTRFFDLIRLSSMITGWL
jgi:hypothetical protein